MNAGSRAVQAAKAEGWGEDKKNGDDPLCEDKYMTWPLTLWQTSI